MNSNEQMREALVLMVKNETDGTMERDVLCGRCLSRFDCKHDGSCWVDKVMSALALPRRNCEVGTAEEQYLRYNEFCRSTYGCYITSPNIVLEWSQMPYEEESEVKP